jgi:hypothetical protein
MQNPANLEKRQKKSEPEKNNVSSAGRAATDKVGGIDLNAANLDMQIKRDGKGVPLPISSKDLGNIKIDGLVPVILEITPVTSLPALVSAGNDPPADQLTMASPS